MANKRPQNPLKDRQLAGGPKESFFHTVTRTIHGQFEKCRAINNGYRSPLDSQSRALLAVPLELGFDQFSSATRESERWWLQGFRHRKVIEPNERKIFPPLS